MMLYYDKILIIFLDISIDIYLVAFWCNKIWLNHSLKIPVYKMLQFFTEQLWSSDINGIAIKKLF